MTVQAELATLTERINALLPAQYQGCFDQVQPVSMGSAPLLYGPDGQVAWDEIWTSFCELALAGGPPHRGQWLAPASPAETGAEPEAYQKVVEEIGRGVWLTTKLNVLPRAAPGWVGVVCQDEPMAVWLTRAIVVENVHACHKGNLLYLPAGPRYRLAKEIKNVVTAAAKTCHYWTYHMPDRQRLAAARLAGPLLTPALPWEECEAAATALLASIETAAGLKPIASPYPGWVGCRCADVAEAVWLLRAVLVDSILTRREEDVLYLPANPCFTPAEIQRITTSVATACRLRQAALRS